MVIRDEYSNEWVGNLYAIFFNGQTHDGPDRRKDPFHGGGTKPSFEQIISKLSRVTSLNRCQALIIETILQVPNVPGRALEKQITFPYALLALIAAKRIIKISEVFSSLGRKSAFIKDNPSSRE